MYLEQLAALEPVRVAALVNLTTQLDLTAGPGGSRMAGSTETIAVFRPVLEDVFPGEWLYATVIALYPSSQLVGHVDRAVTAQRSHLPLQVNRGCWVFHDGAWQQLEAGQVYSMDPTLVHGAVNWGDAVRLHLIVDR